MSEIDKMNHTLERSISLRLLSKESNQIIQIWTSKVKGDNPIHGGSHKILFKLYFPIFLANRKLFNIGKVNSLGKKKRKKPPPSHFYFIVQSIEARDWYNG